MFSTDSTTAPGASGPTPSEGPPRAPNGEWGWLVTTDGRVVLVDAATRASEDRSAA